MKLTIRPGIAIALLFVVVLAISGGSVGTAELVDSGGEDDTIETERLDDGTELWPYTSRAESVEERTLAINLLIYGDAGATERFLREQTVGDWEELDEEEADQRPGDDANLVGNQSTLAWGSADGAVRYVWVDPPYDEPRWLSESYQLKDGTYLGDRHHVRAYTDPVEGEWTALQAHQEYWDWFQLRHSVHTIEESQAYVELEFLDHWAVEQLSREHVGNDRSSDSDGWMTVIELREGALAAVVAALALGSFGVATREPARTVRRWWRDESVQTAVSSLLVIAAIVALYTVVRVGAVAAELRFPETDPKLIAAVFYPLLVCGLPIVAYLSSRQLGSTYAFTAAVIGFVVAVFLDLTSLGVTSLTLHTFVHRIALAVAIGFIAAGASQSARRPGIEPGHVRTGVLLWLIAVVVPLVEFV